MQWSGVINFYQILKPPDYFENITLFECNREVFDEFFSLHGNAQPNFTMMRRYEAERERILKLSVQFAPRKNCLSLLTHHLVAFYSHSQIIWTICNYPGCHLCHVLFLYSITNPGAVFILHRTVKITIFK